MRIAIVQDGPEYLDLERTIDKTISFLDLAKKDKADVVVFGECWMSGYPIWLDICEDVNLWNHEPVKEVWARMYAQSLCLDSPEWTRIQKAASEAGMYVVLGANEVIQSGAGNGTIYNSIFTLNRKGKLVNHHRKLMPTHTERLVHGLGDGRGLRSVATEFGRLGSLICWEHWMPLARQAMHDEGEDIHLALWPMVKEMNHVASRHYAFEGRCIVVAVGQIMHRDELPGQLEISRHVNLDKDGLILRGGSAIYDSEGKFILPQIYNERKLIVADLDLSANLKSHMNLDVSGHYQRRDIFNFKVNKSTLI